MRRRLKKIKKGESKWGKSQDTVGEKEKECSREGEKEIWQYVKE